MKCDMKKIVLLILWIIIHNGVYANKICNDTTFYRDLCLFLVHHEVISREYMLKSKNDYSKLIGFYDINQENPIPRQKPVFSKRFGIYAFDFIGMESNYAFILIKYNDTFKVFKRNETDLIIREIMQIIYEDSQIIDYHLLCKYLKKIVCYDDNMYIWNLNFGSILFIYSR